MPQLANCCPHGKCSYSRAARRRVGSLTGEPRQRLLHPGTIGRVGRGTIGNVAFLYLVGYTTHGASGVVEQHLLLGWGHQTEQRTRLRIIVIVDPVVPAIGLTLNRHRWLAKIG